MSRIMLTGCASGSGKTTVTLALLAALKAAGEKVTIFKCGPDFLDPLFHRQATGFKAYNLDPFYLDDSQLRAHLWQKSADSLSVIEGAMGFYDGVNGTTTGSAYAVAKATRTPVILILNAKSSSTSLAAIIQGFKSFRPENQIKGVIFNHASAGRYETLSRLAREAKAEPLGFIPFDPAFTIPSQRLGLLPLNRLSNFSETFSRLADLATRTLDIEAMLELAAAAPSLSATKAKRPLFRHLRLAVAKDEAFFFIYQENLDLFLSYGIELVFFSALKDESLPENIQGLYIPGGYPELVASRLSANVSLRQSIRRAVLSGLPTIAEGGGFMYLHDRLGDFEMCGVIAGHAFDSGSLCRFGYVTLLATKNNLLCKKGETIRSREFHYWDSSAPGDSFIAKNAGTTNEYRTVHASDTLYAGFPQLYFPANMALAERFIERMATYER